MSYIKLIPATPLSHQSYVNQSPTAACTLHRVGHNEHAPTDEPQVCIKCHRHLAARWFQLDFRRLRGRGSACLACVAERRRSHSRKQRQQPQQKECGRCRQSLKAECFSRHGNTADGLQRICRECRSAVNKEYRQPLTYVTVSSKRCWRCGMDKPAAAYSSARRNVDGLHHECKDCCRVRDRQRWQRQQGQQ